MSLAVTISVRNATDALALVKFYAYSSIEHSWSYPRRLCSSAGDNLSSVSEYAAPDGHRLGGEDDGPKYQRVAKAIEAGIMSGELPPGKRLLPERELMVKFGVSYGTVRHAVAVLRDSGLVQTQHGEGNFVRRLPGQEVPDEPDDPDAP
jgi:DNA-binding transcriptional regulator YhcF (GntR family)